MFGVPTKECFVVEKTMARCAQSFSFVVWYK